MSYPQRIYVLPARRNVAPMPIAPKRSRPTEAIVAELLGDELGPTGPRKRERLTHLTAEEKLERRKMKNRVAAQNARDKKKERSTKIEDVMRDLVEENRRLRMENEKLRRANEMLQEQRQNQNQYPQQPQPHQQPEAKYEDTDIYSNVVYEEEVVGEVADRAFESAAFISAPQQRDKARSTTSRRTSASMMTLYLTILSLLCNRTSTTSSKSSRPVRLSFKEQRAIRRLLRKEHLQKHVRHFRRVP